MFSKRALKAYEERLEKKKPIEKKDRLALGFSAAALIVSSLALSAAAITLYYNVLKLSDEIRVVFERIPTFEFPNRSELHAQEPVSLIFINAGNRPAIINGISVYLWESARLVDDQTISKWDCNTNEGREGKRSLTLGMEPIIIREKEIVRTELAYRGAWDGDKSISDDRGTVKLPLPEWVKDQDEYWVEICVLFQLVTPSNSYAQRSITLSRAIGFTKEFDIYGDAWLDTTPYLIWKHSELVFSR